MSNVENMKKSRHPHVEKEWKGEAGRVVYLNSNITAAEKVLKLLCRFISVPDLNPMLPKIWRDNKSAKCLADFYQFDEFGITVAYSI